jgi:hypothetical protein
MMCGRLLIFTPEVGQLAALRVKCLRDDIALSFLRELVRGTALVNKDIGNHLPSAQVQNAFTIIGGRRFLKEGLAILQKTSKRNNQMCEARL